MRPYFVGGKQASQRESVEVEAVSYPDKRTQRTVKKSKTANAYVPSKKKPSKKVKKLYDQTIFQGWCKACGICSAFCPKEVIGRDDTGAPVIERPDACIGCRFCEFHCPDFAITILERDGEGKRNDA